MKPVNFKFKIKSCSNAMMWYSQHINEEFIALYEDGKAYWTREKEQPFCLNWVNKQDIEVLTEE